MTGIDRRIAMSGLLSLIAVVCSTTLAAGDTILWSENFNDVPNGSDPTGWIDPDNRHQVIDGAYLSNGNGDINIARAYFTSDPFPLQNVIYTGEMYFPERPSHEGSGLTTWGGPSNFSVSIYNRGLNLGLFRNDGLQLSADIPLQHQVLRFDTVRLRLMFDGNVITAQMADLDDPTFSNPRASVSGSFPFAIMGGAGVVNYSRDNVIFDNLQVTPVPEPAAASLLALGGLAMLIRRR